MSEFVNRESYVGERKGVMLYFCMNGHGYNYEYGCCDVCGITLDSIWFIPAYRCGQR